MSERKEVRRGRESGERKRGRRDKGGGGVNGWERERKEREGSKKKWFKIRGERRGEERRQ